jgi:4-carboxymuconolactone decarboxylase
LRRGGCHSIALRAAVTVLACALVPAPRLAPLSEEGRDDQARELLGRVRVRGAPDAPTANIFATLVRHPGLFRRWLPFGGKLLSGKLPARDRELLILRTAWLCHAEYEWGQHRLIGQAAGIAEEEIERVIEGPDAEEWDPFEATLLRAADELHSGARIDDDTWETLAARYDERQLIEVPMVIGHYHMLAFTLNSLGVELEPGVVGFPE